MRRDTKINGMYTSSLISMDDIERGIRNGSRLRAHAFRQAFGKVRKSIGSHF